MEKIKIINKDGDNNTPPVKEEVLLEQPIDNPLYTEPPPEHEELPSSKSKPKTNRFTGSEAYNKFYAKNRNINKYKLGAKGYGANNTKSNQCDCSGGVCRYCGYDRYTSLMTGSKHMYNKRKRDLTYDELYDGAMMFMEHKNGGTNHIGVVAVDKHGNKRFVNISSDYPNAIGDEDLDKYINNKSKRYNIRFFEQGELGNINKSNNTKKKEYKQHDNTVEVKKLNNRIKKRTINN